jgi:hypothetical protein
MIEINEENLQQITTALTEKGYVVKPKEEIDSLSSSFETLKKQEIKTIWDQVDKTIYEITGKEKMIREDNGLERSVNYYQRALKEEVEDKKRITKEKADFEKQFQTLQSELTALKSDNPEAKYEEKYSSLKAEMKRLEEEKENALKKKDQEFSNQLFLNQINSFVSALRGQFRDDIPDVEDGIETKIRRIQGLEAKDTEKGKVFYKNGEPLISDAGKFMTIEDIVRKEFSNYIVEKKVVHGTGSTGQTFKGASKTFANKTEIDAYLKDKFKSAVGSQEWIKERKELIANSGIQ